ncbi:AMP-binding protein [Cuneatibacter sp. NSJ-177]|uniref:DVU_1553 family AMP-dependent CoA ligase n=1 Tax=Cuneatibacter sp. NSJ-177 TaxID=2931401 RepID=UPI001FD33A07|nr:AMP-binding protein [Cuneatibacter sp. NSJ-177]MCJ7836331.1 AMP-binding protein [Cuneatibacter sp. NSJ-177]
MAITMEEGVFELCKNAMEKDKGFLRANPGVPAGEMNEEIFSRYRLYRLQETVRYAYEKSRFYRRKMEEGGIRPEDIKSLEDLKRLPLTEPSDLAAKSYQFLCISQGAVEKPVTYVSSGTVGPSKHLFFSPADVEAVIEFIRVGMKVISEPGEVLQILMPSGSVRGQAELVTEAAARMGVRAITTGIFCSSEEQIEATRNHKCTVWFGSTHMIYRITKEMERKYDLRSLGVRTMFLTIGYLSDTMRSYIENAWNCRVINHYGLTEAGFGMAIECAEEPVYHYNEFGIIAEVINKETGEPAADGEEGELVFTTLGREAMPLIRYRSHDIARMWRAPAACGCCLGSISPVKRRREACVTLANGSEIYPSLFDDTVYAFPQIVDYDVFHKKEEDKERVRFAVEPVEGLTAEETLRLKEELSKPLSVQPAFAQGADLEIVVLEAGALRQGAVFKKLIRPISEAKE